jgi:hypothetical protein
MNFSALLVYVAVGFFAEFITAKNPTPGEKVATSGQVVLGGITAAFVFPDSVGFHDTVFMTAMVLPAALRIAGAFAGPWVDRLRIKRDKGDFDGTGEEAGRQGRSQLQSRRDDVFQRN